MGTGEQGPDGALRDTLGARGWAKVDSWAAFGLNHRALKQQAFKALARAGSAGAAQRSTAPLPALERLLANPALAAALRGYLGGPVRYEGSVVLHLTNRISYTNYASAKWHHDRCGRRLKLFILLHDVDMEGRPTCVADATHDAYYYSHGGPWNLLSRYSDSWVRGRYREECMTGQEGGGFVFDTNSLHRGRVEGLRPRTTVILEFHQHNKVVPLRKGLAGSRLDNPCPSIWPKRASTGAEQLELLHGRPGFPLYPQEPNATARAVGMLTRFAWGSAPRT